MRTLLICEKPDAAARVARALDENRAPRRQESQGVAFFECSTRDDTIIVCSALGHLYAIDSKGKTARRFYPVWDHRWKPKHDVEAGFSGLSRWVRVISTLSRGVDRYVNSCDYDVEGSLIGHSTLQYGCGGAHLKAARMKFSTMTERELRAAFRAMSPHLDYQMVEAGRCRHELDWLYGINLSRLLTEAALKQRRGYATLSTGRVQGPTLKFVVEREEEIGCFVPAPFWTIDAAVEHEGREYSLEYSKEKILSLAEAERIVKDSQGKLLEVKSRESREIHQPPPYPFDLSSLQAEAYRHLGCTPARTLGIAERLYLDALISYPRTSSQKLPPDIGYSDILHGIGNRPEYTWLAEKLLGLGLASLRPTQGPKDDPAHPAIYPTGESPRRQLPGPEAKILDLVTRRFMATFADSSLRLSSRIILETDTDRFFLRGSRMLKPGWTEFYQPYVADEEQELPQLDVGTKVPIATVRALEKFTQPPPRYNPSSLLKKMEEENIGTKATRAEIIEILRRRGYIKDLRMKATPLAIHIIRLLAKHCPLIIDPGFTAKLETLIEEILQGKTTRRQILAEALEHLRPVMLQLMVREDELGSKLSEVVSAQKVAALTFASPCPRCGSALKIVRNPKSGKRFVGCTGKWERGCGFSLPLPQFGSLLILRRTCKVCDFQMVQAKSRGRRRLVSCPRCYAIKKSGVMAERTVTVPAPS